MIKILQLTDLHLGAYPLNDKDKATFELISEMIEYESPDFLAITGDVISSRNTDSLKTFEEFVRFIDGFGIKLAITYGNHDSEAEFDRVDLHAIVDTMTHHVEKNGHEIFSKNRECFYHDVSEQQRLIFVDTGNQCPEGQGIYDYIDYQMVDWVVRHSSDEGKISHLFIHLPLPEYYDACYLNSLRNFPVNDSITSGYNRAISVFGNTVDGNYYEPVAAPLVNTGLFSHLVNETNVKSVYCGHEHDNDFSTNYMGIKLNYGRVTGFNTYGILSRGTRIIELNDNKFITYVKGFAEPIH